MPRTLLALAAALSLTPAIAAAQTAPAPPPARPAPPVFARPPIANPLRLTPRSFGSATNLFADARIYPDLYQQAQLFGRCVAHIGPRRGRELIATSPNTLAERFRLSQTRRSLGGCAPYTFGAPIAFVRGAIAEALYARDAEVAATTIGGVSPERFAAFSAELGQRRRTALPDDQQYAELAGCYASRAPAATRAVFATKHDSDEELAALDTLLASAPECGGEERFPRFGNRSYLRAYLAEAAFQLATVAPSGRRPG